MRTDKHTSGLVVITDDNAEINEGLSYFHADYYTVLASGSLVYTFEVGAVDAHFLYNISSSQFGFTFITHEGVTANNDGTVLTPINHDRTSSKTSSVVLRLNPTGLNVAGATQLRRGYDGTATNPVRGIGGSASLGRKVILKPLTKYSLVITNLSTASPNDIMVTLGWDEI